MQRPRTGRATSCEPSKRMRGTQTTMTREWRWARPDEWDAIASASPCATPFHARSWCESFAAYDKRFTARAIVLAVDAGREALLPLFQRAGALRRGPLSRAVSSQPGVYGGPICADGALSESDWRAFFARLPNLPFARWECFGNLHDSPPTDVCDALGATQRSTHVVELEGLPDDPLESYEAACRRNVRKAQREGVVVARENDAKALEEYYGLFLDSLRRWGKEPGRGYRRSLFERLAKTEGAELWTARAPDGRMAAGGWFVVAPRHWVYWHGAMREDLSALRPANALHHALIVEAKRRGAARYDFNPSGGLEGVETFKRSFGAREFVFPVFTWRSALASRLERWRGKSR